MLRNAKLTWIAIVLLLIFICIIVAVLYSGSSDDNDEDKFCTVNTNSGRIRGKLNQTLFDETPYYSFRGIPFAKPPIGDLRFKVNNNF